MNSNTNQNHLKSSNLDQKVFKTGFFGATDDSLADGRVIPIQERPAASEENDPLPEDEQQEVQAAPLLARALGKVEKPVEGKYYVVKEVREVTLEQLAELLQEDANINVIRGEFVKPKLKVTF